MFDEIDRENLKKLARTDNNTNIYDIVTIQK